MNIDKALEHFKWKMQNKWKPTETDIEAYNSIIEYKEQQESVNLQQNESFAKLWIHQLMLLSNTNMYDGQRAIQVIDEILEESVYDWCMKLKEQLPMMRFKSVALEKYPLPDVYNITELRSRNSKIVAGYETKLTESMKYEISEENIIKFVSNHINRDVNKFEK